MPPRIDTMPRRRRPAVAAVSPTRPTPAATTPPPIREGVDAVVAWLSGINLAAADAPAHKRDALQKLVAAYGRVRSVARDVELLLRARQQREGTGYAAVYADQPPLDDHLAMPLWHACEIARLVKLVADCETVDADDVKQLNVRLKTHVAGVTVREVGAASDFKRRHRIGGDVEGAVEGYAKIQAQLEAEALTAADAAAARDDLVAFGHFMKQDFMSPWHIRVVADALMKCERREIRGLIINMPPRRGKSVLASELFVSWYLGRHPTHDVILGTLSQTFADSLGRKVRNTIQADEFRRVFPSVNVADDSSAAAVFEVIQEGASVRARRGNFKAFGRGAGVTGSGCSALLLDDLLSEQDAYSSTERSHLLDDIIAFRTRMAPDAIWIVINTRYHEDDVVGVVKRDFADDREWHVVTLPEFAEDDETWTVTRPATTSKPAHTETYTRKKGDVLWPERFSAESSEQLRTALLKVAPQKWWGQFMCRPVADSGAMVDPAWFRRYDYADVDDVLHRAVRTVVSVDTSGTRLRDRGGMTARTAITVWAELEDGRAYLVDLRAEPWIYPDMLAEIKRVCEEWRPSDLLIEYKAAGVEVVADLEEHRDWVRTPITAVTPVGPKPTRMAVASPQIRAGHVYIPAVGSCADVYEPRVRDLPWVTEFLNEIMHFPMSRFLDICDSTSQFLNWRRENPVNAGYAAATAPSPARDSLKAALAGPWAGTGSGGGGEGMGAVAASRREAPRGHSGGAGVARVRLGGGGGYRVKGW